MHKALGGISQGGVPGMWNPDFDEVNTHGIVTHCEPGCEPFDVTPDNALDLADLPAFQTLLPARDKRLSR